VPAISSWITCKTEKISIFSEFKSSHTIQPVLKKSVAGYQTIRIVDQAPRFIGPDLDPYCLQRPFKINIVLEIVRKYFHLFKNFRRALYVAVTLLFCRLIRALHLK